MIGKLIPNVFSPRYWLQTGQELHMVWLLVRDPRVPLPLKALPALVLAYLLLPFDLIPGFIPIIGQLDDVALLLISLQGFLRLAPDEVVDEYRRAKDLHRVKA